MKFRKIDETQSNSVMIRFDNFDERQQLRKIKEELDEVSEEVMKLLYGREDKDKLMEECYDLKQAVETLIYNIVNAKDVSKYEKRHIEKMKKKCFKEESNEI